MGSDGGDRQLAAAAQAGLHMQVKAQQRSAMRGVGQGVSTAPTIVQMPTGLPMVSASCGRRLPQRESPACEAGQASSLNVMEEEVESRPQVGNRERDPFGAFSFQPEQLFRLPAAAPLPPQIFPRAAGKVKFTNADDSCKTQ